MKYGERKRKGEEAGKEREKWTVKEKYSEITHKSYRIFKDNDDLSLILSHVRVFES